jgi:hypothetical protein
VTQSNSPPPADLVKNFASVDSVDEPPVSGSEKLWNIWSCQKFIASGSSSGAAQNVPMHESEALPNK